MLRFARYVCAMCGFPFPKWFVGSKCPECGGTVIEAEYEQGDN